MSVGESHSITPSDMTSITRLPVSMGRKLRSICTSARSALGTRHQLPGRQLVVPREVEALQPLEQRGAQVVLHVEREAAADEPPDVREDELHRGRADEQRQRAARRGPRRRSRSRR